MDNNSAYTDHLSNFNDTNIYVGDANVYEVDAILKCRKRRSKTEYLVKWTGYSHEENSWVSADDITIDLKNSFKEQMAQVKRERKRRSSSRTRKEARISSNTINTNSVNMDNYERLNSTSQSYVSLEHSVLESTTETPKNSSMEERNAALASISCKFAVLTMMLIWIFKNLIPKFFPVKWMK